MLDARFHLGPRPTRGHPRAAPNSKLHGDGRTWRSLISSNMLQRPPAYLLTVHGGRERREQPFRKLLDTLERPGSSGNEKVTTGRSKHLWTLRPTRSNRPKHHQTSCFHPLYASYPRSLNTRLWCGPVSLSLSEHKPLKSDTDTSA